MLGTDTRFERGTDWLPGLAADVVGIGPGQAIPSVENVSAIFISTGHMAR